MTCDFLGDAEGVAVGGLLEQVYTLLHLGKLHARTEIDLKISTVANDPHSLLLVSAGGAEYRLTLHPEKKK